MKIETIYSKSCSRGEMISQYSFYYIDRTEIKFYKCWDKQEDINDIVTKDNLVCIWTIKPKQ